MKIEQQADKSKKTSNSISDAAHLFKRSKDHFLSEDDYMDIHYQLHRRKIEGLIEKEEFVDQLPYSEDRSRMPNFEEMNFQEHLSIRFEMSIVFAGILNYHYVRYYYSGGFSYQRFFLHYPKSLLAMFLLSMPRLIFEKPFQIHNRKDMAVMSKNEFTYRLLQEKTDIYDAIDSLLDLRAKYSLYEMNQMKKESIERRNSIVLDTLEEFKNVSRQINRI